MRCMSKIDWTHLDARLLQLQRQLQEADIRGVGQARTVGGVGALQAGLAEHRDQVLQAAL